MLKLLIGISLFNHLLSSTFSYEVKDTSDAMEYLSRFGYLGADTAASMNLVDASVVLKEFQHMAGLNETGQLDSETIEKMNSPRCGNKDMSQEIIPDSDDSNSIRKKRYRVSDSKQIWRKRDLSYKISKFTDQRLRPELIERDVDRAFQLWSQATNLNFIKNKNAKDVDIELGFASARHQDQFPFDGPGKTLAHAFSPGPGIGGDVHFDDHEEWSVDSPKGSNVLFVAVHEIGHALGLSHSSEKGAIMQAFYGGYRPHLKLHDDDINGIQSLYGKRSTVPVSQDTSKNAYSPTPNHNRFSPKISKAFPTIKTITTPPPIPKITTTGRYIPIVTESATIRAIATTTLASKSNSPSDPGFMRPDLCKDSKLDAITAINDGSIFAFKGYYVFKLEPKKGNVLSGWPQRLEFVFKGLEPNIDAAFTRKNGKTYILKGGKYWRLSGVEVDSGYPKSISKHFPGIPDYVDAAFVYPMNEHIYFTKGDKLWRFDPTAKDVPHVSPHYPLPISIWNIPTTGIDAALRTQDDYVYFFKDNKYWKFDNEKFKVSEDSKKPYPRLSGPYLFKCLNPM